MKRNLGETERTPTWGVMAAACNSILGPPHRLCPPRSLTEPPTRRVSEQARRLRERGEAVIHLGIGEPKTKAPIQAILTSAAKLSGGDVKYTPTDGSPSLKKAIIRYTEEHYDKLGAPENVNVAHGPQPAV